MFVYNVVTLILLLWSGTSQNLRKSEGFSHHFPFYMNSLPESVTFAPISANSRLFCFLVAFTLIKAERLDNGLCWNEKRLIFSWAVQQILWFLLVLLILKATDMEVQLKTRKRERLNAFLVLYSFVIRERSWNATDTVSLDFPSAKSMCWRG